MRATGVTLAAALIAGPGLLAPRSVGAAERDLQPPDAQMLLDLDLLRETDLARDRSFLTRMRILERMRVLETLPVLEAQPQTPPPAPAKEVK